VCRRHHFLSLEPGRCPWDEEELLPIGNLADELVEFSIEHGVELLVVAELPERLEPYEGVAAVTYELKEA
jgi:hypothetical protein